ncbi:helix-turn-helix domain-containing protein [Prevotella intermedia]|uniref:Excisionase n=1 Tax=Prevotella intermedia TaxID=28131 RepID=A0A2A6EEI8_PREIN|nr:helix-turn-helix domain-containing protein [Prevotella intermedia]PDP59656.1 excisionase [Prevotella intermedia]
MQQNVTAQNQASAIAMVVLPESAWKGVKADIQDLKELLTKKSTEEAGNEWIESIEARKILGVSPKTWQTYRDRRIIPFAQIGRKILVKKSDLEAFMQEHYISSSK